MREEFFVELNDVLHQKNMNPRFVMFMIGKEYSEQSDMKSQNDFLNSVFDKVLYPHAKKIRDPKFMEVFFTDFGLGKDNVDVVRKVITAGLRADQETIDLYINKDNFSQEIFELLVNNQFQPPVAKTSVTIGIDAARKANLMPVGVRLSCEAALPTKSPGMLPWLKSPIHAGGTSASKMPVSLGNSIPGAGEILSWFDEKSKEIPNINIRCSQM